LEEETMGKARVARHYTKGDVQCAISKARAAQRQLLRDDLPDDYAPDVLCAACRAKGGG
jgi:hypothetical protein